MALARSRLRWMASSMRRSCSTLKDGSLPDKSTKVNISLDSMALTRYSPACAVMPFLDSIRTRRERFSCKASASRMTPFWSLPPAVRLLLSKLSDLRLWFFFNASPIASAALTPMLLPSHSSFCKFMFFSSIHARDIPSSSQRPLRFKSIDMQDRLSSNARVRSRNRTEPSSIPHTVMCCWLTLRVSASTICSSPPSIFFRCSSSSRRLRSSSILFCSSIAFCF
mmetsp:Transcript_83931/g.256412  ORF Transcript_83931/g.256412 Transcript_83931/m.256412 type:complete len:224 (-) Transcript_83931:349-1020(-)